MSDNNKAIVHVICEEATKTGQVIVACPKSKKCAIIDPVLDIDVSSGKISSNSADNLLSICKDNGYTVEWVLDTHIHADHISGTYYIKKKTGAQSGIGEKVKDVQEHFQKLFNLSPKYIQGNFWDKLFKNEDTFKIGEMNVTVLHTPGHTPADLSYYIENDCIFTGDSIFMPDMGTARCDFPGGNVDTLWESTKKILNLPKYIRCFVGHDYSPNGREWSVETTVGKELEGNKHVKEGTEKGEFVNFRSERDAQLGTPRLLYPAMQFNIRGGMPPLNEDGTDSIFVKIPLTINLDY